MTNEQVRDMLEAAVAGKASAEHRLAAVCEERDNLRKQVEALRGEVERLQAVATMFIEQETPGIAACMRLNAKLRDERDRLRAALQRNRQGCMNILEFRKLSGEQWGQRDGYGGRYGALTREEIEAVVAEIDKALEVSA